MTPADIKRRREALGLSQAQLASAFKVSQQIVSDWERGIRGLRNAEHWIESEFKRLEYNRRRRERRAYQATGGHTDSQRG